MNPLKSAPEPLAFPFGFEIMGTWEDQSTLPSRSKTWVRFFSADRQGRQAGRDTFSKIFDSIDLLLFICLRGLRAAAALDVHGCHWDRSGAHRFWVHENLTGEDRERIAEILRTRSHDITGTSRFLLRGK